MKSLILCQRIDSVTGCAVKPVGIIAAVHADMRRNIEITYQHAPCRLYGLGGRSDVRCEKAETIPPWPCRQAASGEPGP